MTIVNASTAEQIENARTLFREYAESLEFNLCFQDFESELAQLPGRYSPPSGRLLLAMHDSKLAGCAAFRPLDEGICEMKRLYVRPEFRGLRIGLNLAQTLIAEARSALYTRMRLDTVETMHTARGLYESLGFVEIEPYYANPVDGATFMELRLDQ